MPRRRPDALQYCRDGFRVSIRHEAASTRRSMLLPWAAAPAAAAAAAAAFAYCRPLLPALSQVVFRQGGQLLDFGPLPSADEAELACDVLSSECCCPAPPLTPVIVCYAVHSSQISIALLLRFFVPQSRRRWTCSGRSTGCTCAACGREHRGELACSLGCSRKGRPDAWPQNHVE